MRHTFFQAFNTDLLTCRLCMMKQGVEAESLLYLAQLLSLCFISISLLINFKRPCCIRRNPLHLGFLLNHSFMSHNTLFAACISFFLYGTPQCYPNACLWHSRHHCLCSPLLTTLYSSSQQQLCKMIAAFPCFMFLVCWLLLTSLLASRLPKQNSFSFWLLSLPIFYFK